MYLLVLSPRLFMVLFCCNPVSLSFEKCQRSLRLTVGISFSFPQDKKKLGTKEDMISPPCMLPIRHQGKLLKNATASSQ